MASAPSAPLTEGLRAPQGDLRSRVSEGSETRAQQEPEEKRPRWSEKYRREALDYHCQIHGIPWLDGDAAGISLPDCHPTPPDERKVIQLATWEY